MWSPRPLRILIPTPLVTVGALYSQSSENIFLVEIYTLQNRIIIFRAHILKTINLIIWLFPMLLQEPGIDLPGIVYQIFWHNSHSHDLRLPTDILILPGCWCWWRWCELWEWEGFKKCWLEISVTLHWDWEHYQLSSQTWELGTRICNSVADTDSQHFLLQPTPSQEDQTSGFSPESCQKCDGIEQLETLQLNLSILRSSHSIPALRRWLDEVPPEKETIHHERILHLSSSENIPRTVSPLFGIWGLDEKCRLTDLCVVMS